MTQVEQIKAAFPQGEVVTLSDGRTHTIKPLKVGQIPKAVKLASSVAAVLLKEDAKEGDDYAKVLLALFTTGSEDLLELIAFGSGMPRAEFDDLNLDDAAVVATALIKANQDFFVHRVMPMFGSLIKSLSQAQV